ncbi:hypothetical protein SAMN05421759_104278 [Roseivivax lentus]|uniref:Dihydrodipicolinate reductase n=1 Tax=Roseivivax lentus TaxID=633194 RepID=A0A1N7MFG8_9RHOB|nr:dihydrodipicolinate reductase [Roseivivax lentus]SIS84875.1 hypothetical protein SAMN05421759_104278 [Roseivivax lentus]
MRIAVILGLCAAMIVPAAGHASAERIGSKQEFVELVQGKRLTRPLVDLQVAPNGAISGTGAAWDVTGNWTWQDGFFCRDLEWGGDPLGYNCQLVTRDGNRVIFTSDRGQGRSAGFTLR